jgi:hypothetical protein
LRLVVADPLSGEHAAHEVKVFAAKIASIRGLEPSLGTWQVVKDVDHPPAFIPAEAAAWRPWLMPPLFYYLQPHLAAPNVLLV